VKEILLLLIPTLTLVPPAVAASFAMRKISNTALEGMTRQPEVAQQLFTSMLVSMALVEALVIYCLVIALMMAAKV
jgi:ATP synthase F0 subunit c